MQLSTSEYVSSLFKYSCTALLSNLTTPPFSIGLSLYKLALLLSAILTTMRLVMGVRTILQYPVRVAAMPGVTGQWALTQNKGYLRARSELETAGEELRRSDQSGHQ